MKQQPPPPDRRPSARTGRRRARLGTAALAAAAALVLAAAVSAQPATAAGTDEPVVYVQKSGAWPTSVAGSFDVVSQLGIGSGAAGTYTVTNGNGAGVSHEIAAGSCLTSCTVTTRLATAPVPFGAELRSPITETVRGTLQLQDGTVRTLRAHSYSVDVPPAGQMALPTPDKGLQTLSTLLYDRPTTVRFLAPTLPPGSPFGEAELFTVRAYQPTLGAPVVHWERSYPAQGPPGARYVDVVIDPADVPGGDAALQWAVGRRLVDTQDTRLTYSRTTYGHRLAFGRATAVWTSTTSPATTRPHLATPTADLVVDVPRSGSYYPSWITGFRVVVTETRLYAGTTTTRQMYAYQPYIAFVDRTGPMASSPALYGYTAPGPGRYTQVWQVYTDDGMPLGAPLTTVTNVGESTLSVRSPALVVGRAVTVTATATFPWADDLAGCNLALVGEDEKVWEAPDFCPAAASGPRATTRTGTVTVTPRAAGPAHWLALLSEAPGAGEADNARLATTVHAERTLSVAVPDAPVGSMARATVRVTELRAVDTAPVAVGGAKVILQRRASGTIPWSTVSTGTTSTGGTVTVPVGVLPAPQQWRAVSDTGAGTWASPVDGSRALATVTWSTVPASAARGTPVSFVAAVAPAEPGSTVRLQVRAPGSTTWTEAVARAVPTSSTGSAAVTLRTSFATAGTWQVRAFRPATPAVGPGTTPARDVVVR